MTSHYSHPAAANYNTAPSNQQRQRGYRICDNCGTVETPVVRFRLCSGCMTTQYCSPECQKLNWPTHKPICQHTAAQLRQASASAVNDDNVAKYLRKFTSAHSELLGWVAFQALQIKRLPANIRQKAFLVDLNYHSQHAEGHRRFSIKSTHVVPRTYIRDAMVMADIQRREERCRQNGGIGALVVIIQCGSTSQVMPVEIDPPSKIAWDSRDDWEDVLTHFVETGRTDFKPICTTSRGIYYG